MANNKTFWRSVIIIAAMVISFLLNGCKFFRQVSKSEVTKDTTSVITKDSAVTVQVSSGSETKKENSNSESREWGVFQLLDSLNRPTPNVYVYPKTEVITSSSKEETKNWEDSLYNLRQEFKDSLRVMEQRKQKDTETKAGFRLLDWVFIGIVVFAVLRWLIMRLKAAPAGRLL